MSKDEEVAQVKRKPKISKDVAEVEFMRFIDGMGIDIEIDDLNEVEKEALKGMRDKVVRAIERGSLTVDADGVPTFTPQRKGTQDHTPIVFYEPDGAVLMQMDRKKSGQDVGKLFVVMAALTKTHASNFNNMKNADLQVCMAITTLFLGG